MGSGSLQEALRGPQKYGHLKRAEGDRTLRILAIDPGTATTGYGIIDARAGSLHAVAWGTVRTSSRDDTPSRLLKLHQSLRRLFDQYAPSVVAVERLYFNRNVTSALAVGQARGVVLLAAALSGVDVHEFTPLQVKQAVTGLGRASKRQVGYMVKVLLNLSEVPRPDDVTDALAIAICCAHFPPWATGEPGSGARSDGPPAAKGGPWG